MWPVSSDSHTNDSCDPVVFNESKTCSVTVSSVSQTNDSHELVILMIC